MTPFSGIRTFLKSKTSKPNNEAYSIIGVPYDLSTTYRSGTRFGPSSIRESSLMLTDGHHSIARVDPVKEDMVWDAGDVELNLADTNGYLNDVENELSKHYFPIIMGGDHSVTLAGLRNAHKRHGKLSVIHFDAHLDTWNGDPNHGTFMREAINEGIVDPKKTIQIGIRSPAPNSVYDWTRDQGVTILSDTDVQKHGTHYVLEEIRRIVDQEGPIYLTFDIDCINPSECPGTGTPEVGGIFTWQILEIFKGILYNTKYNFVGFDVMEVSPDYDQTKNTSLTAATLIWTFLSYQISNKKHSKS